MAAGNASEVSVVPPGFRFHPTDEELLYYYLRKKVAYEPIDLDVIRDVDLNKLEPWDLKDKCRIGSGPQNEWYFFSHKDRKYPTGTRTNRATTAGFWKATGRDKAIHLPNAKKIGMRKTLVFYIGRAPNGHKTDWIMHEYRLNDGNPNQVQEDGWVVCRVYKKKNHEIELPNPGAAPMEGGHFNHLRARGASDPMQQQSNQSLQIPWDYALDNSMHLPQLLSADSSAFTAPFNPSTSSLNVSGVERSQNLMKSMGGIDGGGGPGLVHQERFNGDWSILDKLLSSHQNLDQLLFHGRGVFQTQVADNGGGAMQKSPFQYLGCEGDMAMKFPK